MRKLTKLLPIFPLALLTACASAGRTSPEPIVQYVEIRPELNAEQTRPPQMCEVVRPTTGSSLEVNDVECAAVARRNAEQVCSILQVLGLPPPNCPLPAVRASPGSR